MSTYNIKAVVTFLGMELVSHCPGLLRSEILQDDPCPEAAPPCPQGLPPCPEGGQPCLEETPCGRDTCVLQRTIRLNKVLLTHKLQLGLNGLGHDDIIRVRLYGQRVCRALGVEPRGDYGSPSIRELPDFPGKFLKFLFL